MAARSERASAVRAGPTGPVSAKACTIEKANSEVLKRLRSSHNSRRALSSYSDTRKFDVLGSRLRRVKGFLEFSTMFVSAADTPRSRSVGNCVSAGMTITRMSNRSKGCADLLNRDPRWRRVDLRNVDLPPRPVLRGRFTLGCQPREPTPEKPST
jgi:hypothetical protein